MCRYVLGRYIKDCIQQNYFTREYLDRKMELRACVPDHDSDVIPFIWRNQIDKGLLRLNASGMTTLIEYSHFYLGPVVPKTKFHIRY